MVQNVWSQGYQKGQLLRFEHHATFPKMTMDVDSIVKSLMMITTPLSDTNGNGELKDRGGMFG